MTVYKLLANVQAELKAPKNQHNKFGGYNYRSCEDIVEAAKPLCQKHGLLLTLSDCIIEKSGRFYVEASARVIDTETGEQIEVTAFAREAETKKNMDESQITGAASSYARKYALNGLFAIDDTKDADTRAPADNQPDTKAAKPQAAQAAKPESKAASRDTFTRLQEAIRGKQTLDDLNALWNHAKTKAAISTMPQDWQEQIQQQFRDRVGELS